MLAPLLALPPRFHSFAPIPLPIPRFMESPLAPHACIVTMNRFQAPLGA